MPDADEQLRLLSVGSQETKVQAIRRRARDMVEGDIDTWFEYTLLGVIFINVLALVVSSIRVPSEGDCIGAKCTRLNDKYVKVFETIEWVSVAAFTLEYFMRIWACIEDPVVQKRGPFWGRICYAFNFYPMVDLMSILPNWISLATLVLDPFFSAISFIESPDFTTAGRIFRLVRIFKTDKYINAFGLLGTVLWENQALLLATSFYSVMVWVISATLLYYSERDRVSEEMGDHFQSIPGSMFPTLLMLTGEFPLSDFTPIGQVIAGFVAIVAVAIFAVPTSVLGSGFMQAVQRSQNREWTIDVD
eukprot:jgi/Ulvmu1/6148/UM028_0004.1